MTDNNSSKNLASFLGVDTFALGYSLLHYNPLLSVDWTFFPTKNEIASKPLIDMVRGAGFTSRVAQFLPGYVATMSTTETARLGESAVANYYRQLGYIVSREVPTLGGIIGNVFSYDGFPLNNIRQSTGIRRVDVLASKIGVFGGVMVYAESTAGERSLNGDFWTSGKKSYQILGDQSSLMYNRIARGGGKTLGVVGAIVDAYSTGKEIYTQLATDDALGASLTAAEFAGR